MATPGVPSEKRERLTERVNIRAREGAEGCHPVERVETVVSGGQRKRQVRGVRRAALVGESGVTWRSTRATVSLTSGHRLQPVGGLPKRAQDLVGLVLDLLHSG